jgi:hypothetical protein
MATRVTAKQRRPTSKEALERLKGRVIVAQRSRPGPLRPMRIPGLAKALKEVRAER